MPSPIHLPEIPDAERTALVERLVVLIEVLAQENQRQAETIQQLRDEIAVGTGSVQLLVSSFFIRGLRFAFARWPRGSLCAIFVETMR
jgi:hypothetical protein